MQCSNPLNMPTTTRVTKYNNIRINLVALFKSGITNRRSSRHKNFVVKLEKRLNFFCIGTVKHQEFTQICLNFAKYQEYIRSIWNMRTCGHLVKYAKKPLPTHTHTQHTHTLHKIQTDLQTMCHINTPPCFLRENGQNGLASKNDLNPPK